MNDTASGPIELHPGTTATVGGLEVRRTLPRRALRTIGAWCFVDHFGPTDPEADVHMGVGPHPHTGLHTVTWLLEGTEVHTDSLGSEQPIRPGQVNLMTAGNGIAHAEQTPPGPAGVTHGVQLWLAQPEATRHGPQRFAHHAELPGFGIGAVSGTTFIGSFGGVHSPVEVDSDVLGAQLSIDGGPVELPLDPSYEHAVVVLTGRVQLSGAGVAEPEVLEPDVLARIPVGRDSVALASDRPSTVLVLGGVPFEEQVLMWWNFVGRTREELSAAVQEWNEGSARFGEVRSDLARIPSPVPPW